MFDPDTLQADGFYHLTPDFLPRLFYSHPGLIIGPDAIHYPSFNDELCHNLAAQYTVDLAGDPMIMAQEAINNGALRTDVEKFITDYIISASSSPHVTALSKIRWSGIMSLAQSLQLESRLLDYTASHLTRHAPLAMDEPTNALPARTYPLIKLLGTSGKPGLTLTHHEYVRRSTSVWRQFTPTFADYVKSGPVLCVGVSSITDHFLKLLAELSASPKTCPSTLVFMADEPLARSSALAEYVETRTSRVLVHATIGEFCDAANRAAKSAHTLPLVPEPVDPSPYSTLERYSDVGVFVNSRLESSIASTEHHILHDILFQPTTDRWDPFVHKLDFPRTSTQAIKQAIQDAYGAKQFESSAIVLQGGAGSGKTTLLKRVAFNLATDNYPVLWLRGGLSQDAPSRLQDLVEEYTKGSKSNDRLIVFIDDRFGHATVSPRDIALVAARNNLGIVLVVSGRRSEWSQYTDLTDTLGGLPQNTLVELIDDLDQTEVDSLPDYLCKLHIYSDNKEATDRVSDILSKHTRDTLGLLWFLLPDTRATLEKSITGEYFRLGDAKAFARTVADVADSKLGGAFIQRAYAYVAVAEHAHSPIPTEVLVSALDTDYGTCVNALKSDGPAWGLIYADYSDDQETYCYRTRNAIVADAIVRVLNGGVLHGPGEIRILKELLSACKGSAPAYRAFCHGILIPGKKIHKYEYDEGIELYDTAIDALSAPDRTLLHHKGIYMNDRGHNPAGALEVLETALQTPHFPYASRLEREEYIHNSMASCILAQVKRGDVDHDVGKQQVLSHLDQAHSTSFFNAHAVHVQATLVAELLAEDDSNDLPDSFTMAARALGDIDRAIEVIKTDYTAPAQTNADLDLLNQAREDVQIALPISSSLASDAMEVWEKHRRQEGFVYVARLMFRNARERGRNLHEAYENAEKAIATVEDAGEVTVSALSGVAAEIYYQWRVRRSIRSDSPDETDWNRLYELSSSAALGRSGDPEPLYEYIRGISLAQKGDWAESEQLFSSLRSRGLPNRILHLPRDRFLAYEGGPARFQGTVRQNQDRTFVHVPELNWDFMADRNEKWPERGLQTHVFIRFSFAGPKAVQDD